VFLDPGDAAAFLAEPRDRDPVVTDAVEVALVTALRRQNVLAMENRRAGQFVTRHAPPARPDSRGPMTVGGRPVGMAASRACLRTSDRPPQAEGSLGRCRTTATVRLEPMALLSRPKPGRRGRMLAEGIGAGPQPGSGSVPGGAWVGRWGADHGRHASPLPALAIVASRAAAHADDSRGCSFDSFVAAR
jgi:hypothetical protein